MKRRNIILLQLLVAISIPMMAQQWEIGFGDPTDLNQHSRFDAGMIDREGDAVLIGRIGRRRDWHTQLVKVHLDGSYERRVCEDLPKMLLMKDLVQLDNGNYFTVATRITDTTKINFGGPELWAIIFDGDLDTVSTRVYTRDSLQLIGSPMLLNDDDGTIVACGQWYQLLYRHFPYMYRFDQETDTLASCYVAPKEENYSDTGYMLQGFYCHNILKNPDGNGYIFLTEGTFCSIGTVFFDRDFRFIKSKRYMLGTPGHSDQDQIAIGDKGFSDYFLSDDRLLFFGTRHPWMQGIDDMLLILADLDLNWSVGPGYAPEYQDYGRVNRFEMGFLHEEGRDEQPNRGKSMATVNDTTMYGAYYTWPDNTAYVRTGLCLFDRDMEILGSRYFDEDVYADYSPEFVLPYADGSCLLVMGGGSSLFSYSASKVMRLTREEMSPIPVSVREKSAGEIRGKAYPNPVKDELYIDLGGLEGLEGCRIGIADALGRCCVDRYIRGEGNMLSVGVAGLKAGVYVYRIYNSEKELLKGKFVKE